MNHRVNAGQAAKNTAQNVEIRKRKTIKNSAKFKHQKVSREMRKKKNFG